MRCSWTLRERRPSDRIPATLDPCHAPRPAGKEYYPARDVLAESDQGWLSPRARGHSPLKNRSAQTPGDTSSPSALLVIDLISLAHYFRSQSPTIVQHPYSRSLRSSAGTPHRGIRGHQNTAPFSGCLHPNLQNDAKGIERLFGQPIGIQVTNSIGKKLQKLTPGVV